MTTLLRRLGDATVRRPWATIGAWVVLTATVIGLAGMAGGELADDLAAPGSQSAEAIALLEARFPEATAGTAMAVLAAPPGDRLDDHRDAVTAALGQLADVAHVAAVSDPFASGTVAPDGRIGFAEVVFDVPSGELGPAPVAEAYRALEPARAAGLSAEMGGDAAFITAETETSGAEAVGLVAALLVLLVAFGTVVAALVPISLALVAVAVGLGGITLLANAMEISTAAPTIAAMIGLGVGIDYALFIVARYREERAARSGTPGGGAAALTAAMASSGSAVLFAGGTVVVAMAALVLTGLGFLATIGLATSLVVLVAVATALTLLPALLTLLGDGIDRGRLVGRGRSPVRAEDTRLWRYAHRISARPWPYLVVATALLLTLAAPALWMETAFPDAGDDATDTSHRRAYDLLAEGFGAGFNGPLLLVVDLATEGIGPDGLGTLARDVATDPGISLVGPPQLAPDGTAAVLSAIPTTAPADPTTSATLARVRDGLPPNVAVAGLTAMTDDLTAQLDDVLPVLIAAVLLASFLLLLVVFRSVVVPLKAAVMNLLSIGGAYGIIVAVFQWGWGASLFGLEQTVRIASPMPVIFFAVLFGLSMDYEVFLLSRIREEYAATRDNVESVARGMAATGRVITSAALIMTVVFLSFVTNPSPLVKMMGLGLSTAILLDATVVRLIIVPAAMALMGEANWWLPRWLDRLLPHIDVEPAPAGQLDPRDPPGDQSDGPERPRRSAYAAARRPDAGGRSSVAMRKNQKTPSRSSRRSRAT